jgi:hypothetical protein
VNEKLFFAFLRNALWGTDERLPTALSERQARSLLRAAERQAVYGLLAQALLQNDIRLPQPLLFEVVGLCSKIEQGNRMVNRGVRLLAELFRQQGVDYVIVKGQPVAACYANPLLRQSGDVDYYCDAANFEKSQQAVFRAWGIRAEAGGSDHHVHYDFQGVVFEGHFALAIFFSQRAQVRWQHVLDADKGMLVMIDGIAVKTLSPTLHVFYVFMHLYGHLLGLGIGLRQFCDMAVMLRLCRDKIDMLQLQGHLRMFGMERAYRACGSILADCLGLSVHDLGCEPTDTDRRYGAKILDVVFCRGNMGHYNKRAGFRGWRHNLEATAIKLSHFIKFFPLAPGYSCHWLWHEFARQSIPFAGREKH